MVRKRWSDLTPVQRKAFTWLGIVQVTFAAAAWADLSMRPREFVRGRKLWWALAIAVNFIGPLSYFRWGRRS
ncbi:PLDc N-terminal domain-containing protein [Lentzea kentuckyensis]|uniref:PLDc N-terminal domain-containing protein n=1 Tax=Lentzea kentuckyensis TaxID=360086 RepID=UPI000A38DF20|nr:PLDc N-terminal domain-containing protein [Lentzea kentuckyensis]